MLPLICRAARGILSRREKELCVAAADLFETVDDGAVELEAVLQQLLAALKTALAGNADLIDTRGLGCRLDALDQRRELLLRLIERAQEVGLEHDDEIAFVLRRIEAGAA